jgi:membrane associated rhomboid family serine protease
MPFTCKFCEQSFCSTHRLPENHDCDGLENYTEQSHEAGKVGYDVDTTDTVKESAVTARSSSRSLLDRLSAALPSLGGPGRDSSGRNLPITYLVLGILFAVFFLQVTFGRPFMELFALQTGTVLRQPWTIVTSMFLHGGVMHLLVNSIVLFSFGTEIERMLGDRKFLTLVFAAGIASSVGVLLSGVLIGIGGPTVGISGALFGLVAFLSVVRPSTRVLAFFVIPLKIRTAIMAFGLFDLANLIVQALHAAGGTAVPGLYYLIFNVRFASSGHLSGLLVGLLFGYHVKDRYQQYQPRGILSRRFNRRF